MDVKMTDEEFLTTLDASRIFKKSPETVRLWEKQGKLPAIRTPGGQRLFKRDDVERLARERAIAK